jgi:hypothetical protein
MKRSEIVTLFNKNNRLSYVLSNLCGQQLGSGAFRDVYVFKHDHRWVIKIERNMKNGSFANATEWCNWLNHELFFDFSKFMAPCLSISEYSNVLIQRRAMREIDGCRKPFPEKIPNWFTDTKRDNFGFIGNQFVCVDYSFLVSKNFRMKRAKWW